MFQAQAVSVLSWISLFLAVVLMTESAWGAGYAKLQSPSAVQGRKQSGLRYVEPNLYAPELYADKLETRITLVDLPGKTNVKSEWQMSFQLYFISEGEFSMVLADSLSKGRQISDASQFPNKNLLAEGAFHKNNLTTIQDRTYVIKDIDFKRKIPERQRTKYANLLMVFSTKIYDARLQLSLFRSAFFLTFPFTEDINDSKDIPRTVLFTNLYVTDSGSLFTSQWTRKPDDTTWHHP